MLVFTASCYTTTMGVARGEHGHQIISIPQYAPILPLLQKGRTTVEWTWWRHRNANSRDCPPQSF